MGCWICQKCIQNETTHKKKIKNVSMVSKAKDNRNFWRGSCEVFIRNFFTTRIGGSFKSFICVLRGQQVSSTAPIGGMGIWQVKHWLNSEVPGREQTVQLVVTYSLQLVRCLDRFERRSSWTLFSGVTGWAIVFIKAKIDSQTDVMIRSQINVYQDMTAFDPRQNDPIREWSDRPDSRFEPPNCAHEEQKWTPEEDALLRQSITRSSSMNYTALALQFPR